MNKVYKTLWGLYDFEDFYDLNNPHKSPKVNRIKIYFLKFKINIKN